jgi:hypothetical protein
MLAPSPSQHLESEIPNFGNPEKRFSPNESDSSLLHCDATARGRAKKSLIIAALLLAIIVGVIWGHRMAEAQYNFL